MPRTAAAWSMIVGLAVLLLATPALAQSGATDDAALRERIEEIDALAARLETTLDRLESRDVTGEAMDRLDTMMGDLFERLTALVEQINDATDGDLLSPADREALTRLGENLEQSTAQLSAATASLDQAAQTTSAELQRLLDPQISGPAVNQAGTAFGEAMRTGLQGLGRPLAIVAVVVLGVALIGGVALTLSVWFTNRSVTRAANAVEAVARHTESVTSHIGQAADAVHGLAVELRAYQRDRTGQGSGGNSSGNGG